MAEISTAGIPEPDGDFGIWGVKNNKKVVELITGHNDHDGKIAAAAFAITGLEQGVGTPTDEGMALLVETEGTAVNEAVTAQILRGGHVVPALDYLDGDPMPTATTGDMGVVLNRALVAAQALADADPFGWRKYPVQAPPGDFRVATQVGFTQARAMVRTGIVGAGKRGGTRFLTVGGRSFFVPINTNQIPGSLSEYAAIDCVWSDFESDMTGATAPDPTGSAYKHFKGAGWLRCSFERIYAHGSPATGFGTDYLVDCTFVDVEVEDSGRGGDEPLFPWYNGGRSGFGIAVGWSEDESATFINCRASGNLRSGWLFEYQHQFSSTFRQRFVLIGCESSGNHTGVSVAGGVGVQIASSRILGNSAAAIYQGPNEASPSWGGLDVEVVDTEIAGNGWALLAASVMAWGFSAGDAAPVPTLGGTRIARCHIHHNTEGIVGHRVDLARGGFELLDSVLDSNGTSAVRFTNSLLPLTGVRIEGNTSRGHDRHFDLLVPMTGPSVRGNTMYGGSVGIAYHPAETSTDPIQAANTFYDVDTPVEFAPALADATADRSPSPAAFTHSQSFMAGGTFPTAGWANVDLNGTEATWTVVADTGVQVAGSSGQDALAVRTLASTGVYAEMWLRNATAEQTAARMVAISCPDPSEPFVTGEMRTFVAAGVYYGSSAVSSYYCLFQYRTTSTGLPTVLWESTVPIDEAHVVGIRRLPGSTVTQMFIDGELVHEQDVPLVPVTPFAGIYGVVTSSQNRRAPFVKLQSLGPATAPEEPEPEPEEPAVPLYGDSGAGAAGTMSGTFLLDGLTTTKKWILLGGAGWERTGTGAMKPVSGTSTAANINTASSLGRVGATIAALAGSSPLITVLARAIGDVNNFITFGPSQGGVYRLAHRNAGTTTVLWDSAIAPVVGDKFGIEILDETNIRVLVNGVVVQTVAAASALSALAAGVSWGMYGHFGVDPTSALKDWYWNPA